MQQRFAAFERQALNAASLWRDLDDILLAVFPDIDSASYFSDVGLALWIARFKEFLDARQTLGDVATGHARVVEGTECQLSTWFADRLSSDNANWLSSAN